MSNIAKDGSYNPTPLPMWTRCPRSPFKSHKCNFCENYYGRLICRRKNFKGDDVADLTICPIVEQRNSKK